MKVVSKKIDLRFDTAYAYFKSSEKKSLLDLTLFLVLFLRSDL